MKSLSLRFVIGVLLMAIVTPLLATPAIAAQEEEAEEELVSVLAQNTQEDEMSAVDVVDLVGPAVVTVINLQTVSADGLIVDSGQPVEVGAGTGFIFDDQGNVVTNWHVVTGGTSFVVVLADGTEVDAELIGEDPRNDLAVVRIDPSAIPATVSFGNSTALEQGQEVLAIGSPLGAFGNTVTSGIVSALNRDQLGQEGLCGNYSNLIQHDAAINPGNSGGPLFNMQGEVIGVNTLGIPISQAGVPVQGLFFAVPSNTVVEVVQQILEQGFVSSPYIGISFGPLNPRLSAINDLPVDFGLFIETVEPNTPAAQAGLQPGDIIVALDGNEITETQTFASILLDYSPNDTVELTVLRSGGEQIIPLTFGEVPRELLESACADQIPGLP